MSIMNFESGELEIRLVWDGDGDGSFLFGLKGVNSGQAKGSRCAINKTFYFDKKSFNDLKELAIEMDTLFNKINAVYSKQMGEIS